VVPSCMPTPATPEICNGIDDNCNGLVDDGLIATTCGAGACSRTATCSAGVPTCVAGPPQPERCNNVDDNCDGMIDNNIPAIPCGFGACLVMPPSACAAGVPTVCIPGTPVAEICDGVDNNCDGRVDENCLCDRYVVHGAMGTGLTPASPLGTIQAAITSVAVGTRARVCVAANIVSPGGCVATTYPEAVLMQEAVSVFGGYDPTAWTRGNVACSTTIAATTGQGVYFGHGRTNATQLDGFTILGLGNPVGALTTAAVTIQEGATVTNNNITGAAVGFSIGVDLVAPAGVVARPLIALNSIAGGSGSNVTDSIGVRSTVLAPEIRGNRLIAGGTALTTSFGIALNSSPGTVIADNVLVTSGMAPTTAGIDVSSDVTGVLITRNTILAGGTNSTSLTPARGVFFERCSAGVGSVFANPSISGGASPTSGIGVDILGCAANVDSNALIIGKAVNGGEAIAVRCGGATAVCNILRNQRLVGFSGTATGASGRGVYVASGALALVQGNRGISSCTAPGSTNCQGVMLDAAAAGNVVDGNFVDVQRGTAAAGIFTRGTAAMVSNNLVYASADTGIMVGPSSGVSSEAIVHSNTVVGIIAATSTPAVTNLIASSNETLPLVSPVGVFRNNNAVCLGSSLGRFAFAELGAYADPRVFENNNLYGCDTLYRNADGPALITLIATINTLADITSVGGNLSLDPIFVSSSDYHLQGTSPLIDQGTAAGAPIFDYDGQLRPTRPRFDIGFDEVVP
ncbi:MAG: putative metal-binding motif-containing protein, partial [Deltaproteobacteria bacterium]